MYLKGKVHEALGVGPPAVPHSELNGSIKYTTYLTLLEIKGICFFVYIFVTKLTLAISVFIGGILCIDCCINSNC